MSIEDILGWINRRLLSGTLTVERAPIVRTFVFESGYITSASSNDPGEELGQLLIDVGLVDLAALDEARQVQTDTGVSLSRILTMVGKVDEERLRALLEDKALDSMFDVFTWEDGTFAVERSRQAPPTAELGIAVQLGVCIDEGRKWASRWEKIRAVIPSDDVALRIVDRKRLVAEIEGGAQKVGGAALIKAMERGFSIERIMAEQRIPRFRMLDFLAQLADRGVVQVPQVAATSKPAPVLVEPVEPVSADTLVAEAQRLAASGERSNALELLRQALALDPDDGAIQKLFRDLERALFAELSRELLASFRVPRLLVEREALDRLELSDAERYLAGRIDGRWDLLSLMRVSPLREVEALIIFKRLADRGIISL